MIKASEKHYYTVFLEAPDGMSISRLSDGLFIDVNHSFSEMFGYNRDQIIGKTSYELHFWQNIPEREQLVRELTKAEAIDNFDAVIVSGDGQQVNVMVSARVVDIEAERCLLLSFKNVTVHSQVLASLRDSEKKFKEIFETTPDSIIVTDSNGLIHDVNSVFEVMSGYSREQVIGKSTLDIGLWEDPQQRARLIAEVHQHGKVQNVDLSIWTREQQRKSFLVSATQIKIDGEQMLLAIARDVTRQKSAEQVLRDEERRYRDLSVELQTILEAIPDALILWSDSQQVVWANRNAKKYLKIGHDKAVGKNCRELSRSPEHLEAECVVEQAFSRAEYVETLEKFTDGDIWAVKAFPIVSEAGQVIKVLTLASDITERLRLREEASRSARLAALGELAAGVAHEINNPTGLILMNTSLVKDVMADLKPFLEEQLPAPGTVHLGGLAYQKALDVLPEVLVETIESGHRIRQIVEDLKDFSRPAPQDTFEPVDLNEVVRKTLRIMRLAIDKATDSFAVEYEENLPKVSGNVRQLEQVLVNLLSNSCQALQDRSEGLVVAVSYDAEKQKVCLRVWDEGRGIEGKILSQITDPFFTTRRESGGTGLGLSVSARIVEEHKGHIHFESTPGYGTTVTVHLPAMTTQ